MKHLIFYILFLLPTTVVFPQSVVLEAFGDSLTAGLLDYTNVTHQNELETVSHILSDLAMFKLTKDRSYLKKHEQNDLAWPQLLAEQLKTSEVNFEVRNYGVSGAKSETLYDEVVNAPPVSPRLQSQSIAFFFIGHNDLCHNSNTTENLASEYSSNIDRAIEAWDKTHEGSRGFLVSVAEVQRIYPLLEGQTWYESSRGRYRCNESWDKLFPYCPVFFRKHKEGTLENYLTPRVEALNKALEDLTQKWRNKSSRNQFFHIQMAPGSDFRKNFFAVDCYHLSNEGQAFVSDQIFRAISWQ